MQNACNQTLCAQAVHGITVQEGAHKRREGDLQGVPGRREAQAAAQQSEMAAFLCKESKGVGRYMYTGWQEEVGARDRADVRVRAKGGPGRQHGLIGYEYMWMSM